MSRSLIGSRRRIANRFVTPRQASFTSTSDHHAEVIVIHARARRPSSCRAARISRHQLLIRRNRSTGELAFYRCYSPRPVPLATLVKVAGQRWRVEETFQSGKGLAGLDEHQVRRFASWSRWVTLAMLAHAFLAVVRADEHTRHPGAADLIPLTCNEIQRLFTTLGVRPVHDAAHRFGWSDWRRRQARAQTSHYSRQAALQARRSPSTFGALACGHDSVPRGRARRLRTHNAPLPATASRGPGAA